MLRGEVRLTDLEPARGSESNERRPAVIVSNNRANASAGRSGRGVVTVVPVTSNVARVFPFQTLLPADTTGLRVDAKAQAEQVRSVACERVGRVVGHVPASLMAELDEALRLHLEL
jgi:mRNA interferase MazF